MTNSQKFSKSFDNIKHLTCWEQNALSKFKKEEENYNLLELKESVKALLGEYLNAPALLSFRKSKFMPRVINALSVYGCPYKRRLRIVSLPQFISYCYEKLDLIQKNKQKFKTTKLHFREFKGSDRKQINNFKLYTDENFKLYVSTLIIHGSCADSTTTEFSDLDTFLVIKKGTVSNHKLLIKFKKKYLKSLSYLYKFDCLQHHNHMIVTEFDLDLFLYHWLPPQVMSGSTVILGERVLELELFKSKYYLLKNYYQLLQRFRSQLIFTKKYNHYSFKNDLSVLSLLPVLYAQSKGFDLTKSESFNSKLLFAVDKNGLFKKITSLRKSWKVPKATKYLLSNLYNPYFRIIALKKLMPKIVSCALNRDSLIKPDILAEIINISSDMSSSILNQKTNDYKRKD